MAFSGGREPRNKNKGGVHVADRPQNKGGSFRGRGHKAQEARQMKNESRTPRDPTPPSEQSSP